MNQTDEILAIDTPENVIFDYSLAGLGSRFLAALVDSAIIVIMQAAVFWVMLFFLIRMTFTNETIEVWFVALLSLLAFLMFWGYYIFFEIIWNGQSLGKRMVGIRVIRRDGTPVTLSEVLIRNLVRVVDFLPYFYGVGVVAMFMDGHSRRLGDMAAGTLVVHDAGAISIESMSPERDFGNPAGQELPEQFDFPIRQLSGSDLQLLEDYIERRQGLANRSILSVQVLKKLYNRVGMKDHPFPVNPDQLLVAIHAAVHVRSDERSEP
jgi:uncharacterized RDD family membrane protein YckC